MSRAAGASTLNLELETLISVSAHLQGDVEALAVAHQCHVDYAPRYRLVYAQPQVAGRADLLAVELDDDVALLQPREVGGGVAAEVAQLGAIDVRVRHAHAADVVPAGDAEDAPAARSAVNRVYAVVVAGGDGRQNRSLNFAVVDVNDLDRLARRHARENLSHRVLVADGLAVEARDDVAADQTGAFERGVRAGQAHDESAAAVRRVEVVNLVGDRVGGQRSRRRAPAPARDAVAHRLGDDARGGQQHQHQYHPRQPARATRVAAAQPR